MQIINKISYTMLLALGALATVTSALAEPQQFNSGKDKNQLVELYTSEGCSSCPPADRLVSSLKTSDELWQRYIPIAFHVDYWDYLGWKDPFASAENSERQRNKVRNGEARSVYTPAFFVGGNEWRGYFRKQKLISDERVSGNLSLTVDDNQLVAKFDPSRAGYSAKKLHIAVLGMNRSTEVPRGENAGRHLAHDFVSLKHIQMKGTAKQQWKASINLCRYQPPLAIAAWVDARKLPAIQAVGGELDLSHCKKG